MKNIHYVNTSPSNIDCLFNYFKEAMKTGELHEDISDLFTIKILKEYNEDGSDRMIIYAA
jgi:hypothetical protein